MFKDKPVTILIASGLLIVLIVVTAVFQVMNIDQGFRPEGQMPGNFQPGERPTGEFPSEGMSPQGGGEPGNNGNFQPPSAGFQDNGNFNGNSTSMKLMQLLSGFQIAGVVVVFLLGILAVVGMLLGKNWGRIGAIVTSILVVLISIPSLFRRMETSSLIELLAKVLLSVAIIVLCFLPKSKQAVTPA